MVSFLQEYFNSNERLVDLNRVSDGICENNAKNYVDFDQFVAKLHIQKIFEGNTFASCDTILFNIDKNHLIFVEFKDMDALSTEEEIKTWWKMKNSSIYLKMADSILGLSYYLKKEHAQSFDDFMDIPKSFFYVYRSSTFKNKINKHLEYKFSRYHFLFKNIRTLECTNFKAFLTKYNL
jgi:hypothetical protein